MEGVEVQLHSFLTSALDGSVWSVYARPLDPRGKSPRYPMNKRLGEPMSRSGLFGKEKNLLPLPGFYSRIQACNLVTIASYITLCIPSDTNCICYYFSNTTCFDQVNRHQVIVCT